MSFPRYEKVKDSGVEWIGSVPHHWVVQPLKRHSRLLTEKTDRRTSPIALENIEGWTGRYLQTETEFEGDGVDIQPGDILFGKLRPYLAKAFVAQSAGEAVGDFLVIRADARVEPRFAQYQLLSRECISIINGSTFGSKMPRASWDFVGMMPFSLPPRAEQAAIATFLDYETAKIDALVEAQKRLIELLKEKRQAVISHAVTKGLNPNAPMKDSGVEWLGEVPAHWSVARLGYLATVENGTTPSRDLPEYWSDGEIPWLASGEVNKLNVEDAEEFITNAALTQCSLRLLPAGTVIVGLIGQGKTRGMSAILRIAATINQNLAAVCPGPKVDGSYLLYLFHAMYEWLREAGRGGNQAAMNCEMLRALLTPLPPLPEQAKIIAFVDAELARIDALSEQARSAMTLLQERRTALISAAVTGKIDVRPSAAVATAGSPAG